MTGRDTLKERSSKPVRIAESDIDVSIKHHCRPSCVVLFAYVVQLPVHMASSVEENTAGGDVMARF